MTRTTHNRPSHPQNCDKRQVERNKTNNQIQRLLLPQLLIQSATGANRETGKIGEMHQAASQDE